VLSCALAQEQAPDIPGAAPAASRDLYLEVFINGLSTDLIGHFTALPGGGLAATAQELTEVGLKPAAAGTADGLVRVDQLPGVAFEVDMPAQRLHITTTDAARAARVIDLSASGKNERQKPGTAYGGVLNYTLFASSNTLFEQDAALFQGLSGGFDARLFGPFGTLDQSFIAGYSDGGFDDFVRLNTTWNRSDPERLLTWRAGDFISGGLSWTRPVYLGGLQLERNFALRPDLVTLPLPSFSGTAAVPSTLEVYTQNARTYVGEIAPGPFQVVNLPAFTGGGEARVVLRDSLGRETVTSLPYYASSMLLRHGLFDFSAELGYPRRNFGIESSDYDDRLMGALSARYGLTDRLTLEGHVEGGGGLFNGGLGIVSPLGSWGAFSVAVAGSHHEGQTGSLVNAALELDLGSWSVYGRVQRAFGDYEDMASATSEPARGPDGLPSYSLGVSRAVDQVTLSIPTPLDLSSLNLSYTNLTDADGERSRIVGLSYNQQVFERGTIHATAYSDLDDRDSFGIFAGLSVSFGSDLTASTGIEHGPDGPNLVANLAKPERLENGSVGWRLGTSEGDTANRSAAVSYRSGFGRLEAGVQQYDGDFRVTAQANGAVAVAGGGVFASNRIDDAFAVVDVGTPGVEVQFQNRAVGKTNRSGRLLVPDLRSYEPNMVSIDPANLPIDADVPVTRAVLVPANRSGVVVRFGVSEKSAAALVAFIDADGNPLPAGLEGRLEGDPDAFVIGYDGEAYIHRLQAKNTALVEFDDGSACRADFSFRPAPGEQVAIRKVVCR